MRGVLGAEKAGEMLYCSEPNTSRSWGGGLGRPLYCAIGANITVASSLCETRKGAKLTRGISEAVAKALSESDVALDLGAQHGGASGQGCATAANRLSSAFA